MQWALVSTDLVSLYICTFVPITVEGADGPVTQYIQTCSNKNYPAGTICEFIEYDGIAPYTPPQKRILQEVADDKKIGDLVDP